MITSILSISVDCDAQDRDVNCHYSIDTDINPVINDLSQEAYHSWLENYGWLVIGEYAYCPVCRYQLHE